MTDDEISKRLSFVEDDDGDEYNPVCYYVQVYADEDQTIELENFCIYRNDIEDIYDFDEVEEYAIDNVRECLPEWIRDYYEGK